MQSKLKRTRGELYDLQWEVSNKQYHNEWATKAIQQKSVDIIGGFEYNTRYIPVGVAVTLVLSSIACTVILLLCGR